RAATRWESACLVSILLLQAASYAPELSSEFRFIQMTGRDDIEAYVALGHSLANGRGYTRSLDEQHFVPHKHWPPGFPLLLAAGFLFGDSLLIPQLLVAGTALANSVLLWLLARRLLEPA